MLSGSLYGRTERTLSQSLAPFASVGTRWAGKGASKPRNFEKAQAWLQHLGDRYEFRRDVQVVSAIGLDIVTCGWEYPGWGGDFYPSDLPAEWRLTYFANEFPAVLVPGDRWRELGEASLHGWSEDVPDGFRFYLEDPGAAADPLRLGIARRALGAKLEGVVSEARASTALSALPVARFRVLRYSGDAPEEGCLPAWRIPCAHVRDLRAGRAWLESLNMQARGGRGLLVLAGEDIGAEDLMRWRHLALLMFTGVA